MELPSIVSGLSTDLLCLVGIRQWPTGKLAFLPVFEMCYRSEYKIHWGLKMSITSNGVKNSISVMPTTC